MMFLSVVGSILASTEATAPYHQTVMNSEVLRRIEEEFLSRNGVDGCEWDASPDHIPVEVDWANHKNFSWPVKNQGTCGSCWAFSTAGAIEGLMLSQGKLGKEVSASEQQLVSCNEKVEADNAACDGGWPALALSYYNETKETACTEDVYPYVDGKTPDGVHPSPFACKMDGLGGDLQCTDGPRDFKCMKVQNNVESLKGAIAKQPVSVLVFASGPSWGAPDDAIIDDPCLNETTGEKQYVDHAVLAVGYGVENGVEYFKIRNSWGPSWGQDGYTRLKARNAVTPEDGTSCILSPSGGIPHIIYPAAKVPSPPTPSPTPTPTPPVCQGILPAVSFTCAEPTSCCGHGTMTPFCMEYEYNTCCQHGSVAIACGKDQQCGVAGGLPSCIPLIAV